MPMFDVVVHQIACGIFFGTACTPCIVAYRCITASRASSETQLAGNNSIVVVDRPATND